MNKEYLNEMARTVQSKLPDNHGFILLAFPYDNENGKLIYTSSADREDAIKILKTFLFHCGASEEWMKYIK